MRGFESEAYYDPVCGMPINQTFSNPCFACLDTTIIYYLDGECL